MSFNYGLQRQYYHYPQPQEPVGRFKNGDWVRINISDRFKEIHNPWNVDKQFWRKDGIIVGILRRTHDGKVGYIVQVPGYNFPCNVPDEQLINPPIEYHSFVKVIRQNNRSTPGEWCNPNFFGRTCQVVSVEGGSRFRVRDEVGNEQKFFEKDLRLSRNNRFASAMEYADWLPWEIGAQNMCGKFQPGEPVVVNIAKGSPNQWGVDNVFCGAECAVVQGLWWHQGGLGQTYAVRMDPPFSRALQLVHENQLIPLERFPVVSRIASRFRLQMANLFDD